MIRGEQRHRRVFIGEPLRRQFEAVRRELVGFQFVAGTVVLLDDVPAGTVVGRLTLDGRMPRWQARLAVPLFAAIRLVERWRGKSDALLVVARRRPMSTA